MPLNVSVGDMRNKAVRVEGDGRTYTGEIPVLLAGVERTAIRVELHMADDMTNAEALAMFAGGFSVRFNG